jgi:hypothetical protein
MSMAKKKRMTIHQREETTVLDLGAMDIWDGTDLALLRETLTRLIEVEQCRCVGVDMEHVKYIPSGFFGMLYDWHDKGVTVCLYSPQANVKNMLWFRQFFEHVCDGRHMLRSEPKEQLVNKGHSEWNGEAGFNGKQVSKSIAAAKQN